ncbi:EamA family transporter [Vibrio sp. ZSDE26]|uniref:EamA family transporter n=1 Tax=Vibrio amylolyticus TaxID=2847292 RepID=A0A9X2BHZ2_9VIBR|nr:EamA family transporter [Vibrio amylolyticus]MCK6264424.1 EamA family transporter [Vibrio amylolyticus]
MKYRLFNNGTAIAVLAVIAAIMSITAGAALAKSIFSSLNPESVTVLRLSVSALILLFVLKAWKAQLRKNNLISIILYGATIAGMNLFFYMSIKLIPIGVALGFELTGPLLVSALFSKNRLDLIWVLLAAGGIYLLIPSANSATTLDPTGIVYALIAGIFWGAYIITGKKAGNQHGPKAPALGLIVSSIFMVPVGIQHLSFVAINTDLILIIVAVALLSSAVPLMLEMVALRTLPTKTYGVLTSGEPVMGAIVSFIILGEQLSNNQILGIVTIMIASIGVVLSPSPSNSEPVST